MFWNKALKQQIEDLKLHLKNSSELNDLKSVEIAGLKEHIKRMKRKEVERVEKRQPLKAMRMVGIKFNALFDGRYQKTEFKTGVGPCGKNVKWFHVTKDERRLCIRQYHVDGSHKDFEYRLSDIDGRIQYDHEEVFLFGEDAELERVAKSFSVRPRYC